MSARRMSARKGREPAAAPDQLMDVALAAISSYKKQEEVDNFIAFVAEALKRNSEWLDNILTKIPDFKCVLMTGAGPNRFNVHEEVYPSDGEYINVGVQMTDSEDHDKIALAALMKITNSALDNLIKYVATNMMDNPDLKEALYRGRRLGVTYAVLKPVSDKEYRFAEKITLGTQGKVINFEPAKKKRRETSLLEPIVRRTKHVV